MVTKLKTEKVVGALKAAGLVASVLSRREQRSGFKATQFNQAVVAVQFHGWADLAGTDHAAESGKLESVLSAAGFKVCRPWPDKTILAVTL